jgi:hypothetical protein
MTKDNRQSLEAFTQRRLRLPVWSGVGQNDAPNGHALLGWIAAEVCEAKVQWPDVCSKLKSCKAALLDCGLGKASSIAKMTSHAISGLRILRPDDAFKQSMVNCCTCKDIFALVWGQVYEIAAAYVSHHDSRKKKNLTRIDDDELYHAVLGMSECCF